MIVKLLFFRVVFIFLFKFTKVACDENGCNAENSNLKVSVPLDTLNPDTITFINDSIQPIFEELSSCVQWDLMSCSTSEVVEDVLQCKDNVEKCNTDVLYACASNYFTDQLNNLAKFFICLVTSGDKVVEGQRCANQAEINWNYLQGCKPCSEAGPFCQNQYNQLVNIHQSNLPKVMFNLNYDAEVEKNAIKDLKGTICNQIKLRKMQCSACDGSVGGEKGVDNGKSPRRAPPGTPNYQLFDDGKYFSYNGFLLPNTSFQLHRR